MRIGIVGAESSHTTEMLRLANDEDRLPDARVVAVVPVDVAAPPRIDPALIVDNAEDLADRVDGAFVATRDGATHRTLAEPLLRAGLPVWVDKPFATGLDDARALIDAALPDAGPVWSRSAVRFASGVQRTAELAAREDLAHLHLVGPADPAGPYSGIAFYGVHLFEVAVEVLGTAAWTTAPMQVQVGEIAVVATTRLASTPVTCSFVRPRGDTAIPFHLSAVTTGQVRTEALDLGRDYLLPAAENFMAVCAGTVPTQPDADLLAPVHLVEMLRAELDAAGTRRD